MPSTRGLSAGIATTLLSAILGFTPVAGQVHKDDVELSVSGSVSWFDQHFSGDSRQAFSASVGTKAGFFVSNRLQIGGLAYLIYTEPRHSDERSYSASIGPTIDFHFHPESRVVPYTGLTAGWLYSKFDSDLGDNTSNGWFAEGRGGANFFISSDVAVKLQLQYTRRRIETDNSAFMIQRLELEEQFAVISAGLAFFMRRATPTTP